MFSDNLKIIIFSVKVMLMTTTHALIPISFANATTLDSGGPKADFVEGINDDGHVDLLVSTKQKLHYLMKISHPRFWLPIPTSVSLIFDLYGASYDI